MQCEIVDDKVREFYAFHLNQLLASGARNVKGFLVNSKNEVSFNGDKLREEYQQKHTSKPFTDEEEAVYAEKRDKYYVK